MSVGFSAAELVALDAQTLRDLLDVASGDTPEVRAAYLGLDVEVPEHRQAVEAAYGDGQPYSPPIGAAQAGVSLRLTPTGPAPDAPGDALPGPEPDALSLPEPDPAGAADMADMLAASAGTGRPFMAGTFALYSDPSGAVVIVTETETAGVRRDVIPRKAVKVALDLMAGKHGMIGKLGGLLGRGLIGG